MPRRFFRPSRHQFVALALAAIAVAPAACSAQTSAPPQHVVASRQVIEHQLAGDDPRLTAWGAYDAGHSRDTAAVPALLALADRWQPLKGMGYKSPEESEYFAMANVVDALIVLHATVPAETLRRLAPNFPNQVAALIFRLPKPEARELHIEFFEQKEDSFSISLPYACAAALIDDPPPGFAARLLSGVTVRATVRVDAPNPTHSRRTVDMFHHYVKQRENWPPIPTWEISPYTRPDEGGWPVSGSSLTLLDFRAEVKETNLIRYDSLWLNGNSRIGFLIPLIGSPAKGIPWRANPEFTVALRSQEQFDRDLLAFVADLRAKQTATANELIARNLLTPAEWNAVIPPIVLLLVDANGEAFGPIEGPTQLPPGVTIVAATRFPFGPAR